MEFFIFYVLISYIVGVALYTVIVRNDAMHKHNPHVNIWSIVKEGLRGIGIGFLVAGAIITLLILTLNWLN